MIIQSSNMTSSAFRRYETHTRQERSFSNPFESTIKTSKASNSNSVQTSDIQKLRQETLDYLLNLLFGRRYTKLERKYSFTDMADGEQSTASNIGYFYEEQEMIHFETTGTAITADGREISFQLDLSMSRSYMEISGDNIQFNQPYVCDPLVINLNGNGTTVTDQKFLFDIDGDGDEESISQLGVGNGYLALDQNEDGIINNGNELFGTQSGNGFKDLAAYDKDQNGWIDEADEIFQKLKVWTVDENGVSTLLSLKEAGVGAIYLGAKDTPFSLTNAKNEVNAIIRQTGMFLFESGRPGTIQQVDMSISNIS